MDSIFSISEKSRELMKKETAELYMKQAEKELKCVVDVANKLTDRGYQLLSILLAVLTGFSWVLSLQSSFILTVISSICIGVCTVCCIIILRKVISTYEIWSDGKAPLEMDIEAFLTYYHEKGMDSKQYINIISDELEAVQQRITLNVQKTKGVCQNSDYATI